MEWSLLISARRLVILYISNKFCEIISNGIKVIERTLFLYWKLQRGIIPHLEWYQSYGADTNDQPLTDGRTDGRTDTQKFGGYNIIPHHFLWRGIKIEINQRKCGKTILKYLFRICQCFYGLRVRTMVLVYLSILLPIGAPLMGQAVRRELVVQLDLCR